MIGAKEVRQAWDFERWKTGFGKSKRESERGIGRGSVGRGPMGTTARLAMGRESTGEFLG